MRHELRPWPWISWKQRLEWVKYDILIGFKEMLWHWWVLSSSFIEAMNKICILSMAGSHRYRSITPSSVCLKGLGLIDYSTIDCGVAVVPQHHPRLRIITVQSLNSTDMMESFESHDIHLIWLFLNVLFHWILLDEKLIDFDPSSIWRYKDCCPRSHRCKIAGSHDILLIWLLFHWYLRNEDLLIIRLRSEDTTLNVRVFRKVPGKYWKDQSSRYKRRQDRLTSVLQHRLRHLIQRTLSQSQSFSIMLSFKLLSLLSILPAAYASMQPLLTTKTTQTTCSTSMGASGPKQIPTSFTKDKTNHDQFRIWN